MLNLNVTVNGNATFNVSEGSEAPKAHKASRIRNRLKAIPGFLNVIAPSGTVLRVYNPAHLTPNGRKIVQAMALCAAEGWHLWEMQFALFCKVGDLTPCEATRPEQMYLRHAFEPTLFLSFNYVRSAFKEYAKSKRNSIIAKLDAI